MSFRTTKKLLALLPILLFALMVTGQNTTFTYQFDSGNGSACAPASVNFSPTTTLVNPTYTWQVNGVTFSNQTEPIRIFPVGGDYNICLYVDDGTTTESFCEVIPIVDQPTVILSNDVSLGCSPLPIIYTITSTTQIDSIVWDLGDGTVINQSAVGSTIADYSHTYASAGNFSPIITIFDENGCEVTETMTNAVQVVNTPSPTFTADASIGCAAPHTVNFNNTTAMSPGLSFYWDFGVNASSNSTAVNPSYTYNLVGSYDVTLIVSNDNTGCKDTLVLEDFINIGQFDKFQYEILDNGNCSLTEVGFSFYDSGNVQSVLWDFGDGNTSSQVSPTYTYNTANCYFPSLTIITTDGCTYNTTASECINTNGPVIFDYSTSGDISTCDPVAGTTVSFTGISPTAVEWHWDFGGLDSSDVQNPTFTFTGEGSYPVTLTVTFPDGCQESVTNTTVEIAPLEANFSSNVVDGCDPLQVFFYNETEEIDPFVSFEWDFDGGVGLTNIAAPVVNFPDTGTYDISLIVETTSGCKDTILMENYIQVGMETAPEFSADILVGCMEDQIQFTSESGPLTDEWYWDFGDGGTSTEEHPIHEYADTGKFDVMLISYFNGCPDTLIKEDFILINLPKAGFSITQHCNIPGFIQFWDESEGAVTMSWDFGDGNTSIFANTSHTYASNGCYTVTQTVYNSLTGCEDTETMEVCVTSSTPEFTMSDFEICMGDTISVVNSSIGADCYAWSFPPGVGMITTSFCDAEPQFYFPSPGAYFGFCVTISDGSTCSSTYCLTDTVYVSGTVADFTEDVNAGCAPLTVNFNNTSYAINETITSYYWDFGDTNTSTDPNPSHTYTETGEYTVSLLVQNGFGCTDELVMDSLILVDKIDPFFIPQVTNCAAQEASFTNASTSYDNNLTYTWDFGDGNTSALVNPTHAFATTGTYTVCLTAENASGCSEQICNDVNFEPLTVDFSADQTYQSCPIPPLVSTFTAVSTNAVSWFWDFGDNATSALENPAHSYNETGSYTVCLTVTSALGCTETICKTDYIIVDGPSGTMTTTPLQGCADLDVQFIIESQNALSYKWDFGDGNVIDTLASGGIDTINYTYTVAGSYTPVVLVEDVSGCQVPILGETILVESIFSDFVVSQDEACEASNTPFEFSIALNDPASVISINWEFPGSETPTATGLNPTGIIYNQPGYHDVTVTVNSTYCESSVTKDSMIYIHPLPTTNIQVTPSFACTMENLYFQDVSTVEGDSIVSWTWTVDNTTYTDSSFFHQFTTNGFYNVTLETTSGYGCVNTTQQSVIIYENPIVNAGNDVFLCNNETANLNATVQTSDPVTYAWSPAAGLSCTDCQSPVANPMATTTYTVTATSGNGCTSTDEILVEVTTQVEPVVTISPTVTICEGESTTLNSSLNIPAGTYEWNTSASGLSCYDCSDPTASPTSNTTYTVIIYSAEGCSATNSVLVEVIPTVDLIDVSPTICIGGSTQLEVTQGTNITWSPSTGLSCTICPDPIASPTETTTYTVTSLIENQCTITDEVTVEVFTPGQVDAGEDFEICQGFETQLDGNYPLAFSSTWTFNGNVIATNTPTPTITADQSGYYILEVDNGSCVYSDTVLVQVKEKVEIFADDVSICEGETAFLEVTGDAQVYTWLDAPGISDPNSQTPSITPTETTTYMVVGEYGECEADTALVTVEVLPYADISLPNIIYFADGEQVELDAGVTNPDDFTYFWTPPIGLSCNDCPNPVVTAEEDITYTVMVENELGCLDSASVLLRKIFICNDELIVVPNAFTPNGDGNNDRFNVRSELVIDLVRIYNRWGEVVYENQGNASGWDGTYKGQKLNRDVFVYYIEATCEFNGSKLIKTGDLTLIR